MASLETLTSGLARLKAYAKRRENEIFGYGLLAGAVVAPFLLAQLEDPGRLFAQLIGLLVLGVVGLALVGLLFSLFR